MKTVKQNRTLATIYRQRWLGASALVAAALVLGGEASGQSLNEALALAYQANPTLEAQRASLRSTDEEVPEALGAWMPELSISTSAGLQWVDPDGSDDYKLEQRDYSLSLSQTLFQGGSNFAGLSYAENKVMEARAALVASEQSVLLQAVQAYMDVLQNDAVVELRRNNVQVLQRQLEATRDRFNVGENTRTDVAQAESRVAAAQAELRKAQGDLSTARATYRQIIGEMPGTLSVPQLPSGLPGNLEEAIEAARSANPSVTQYVFAEKASQDSIDSAFAGLLPSLSVSGSVARSIESGSKDSQSEYAQIKGTLSIPLYQGSDQYSAIRQAKQNAGKARLEVDEARAEAVKDATDAWEALQSAIAQITSYEAAVTAADVALEGVRQEAAVGSRTVLDVLDAEQEALDAQVRLVEAQRNRFVAAYQLLSAVGGLTAANLGLSVPLYDVEEHYDEVKWKLIGWGD